MPLIPRHALFNALTRHSTQTQQWQIVDRPTAINQSINQSNNKPNIQPFQRARPTNHRHAALSSCHLFVFASLTKSIATTKDVLYCWLGDDIVKQLCQW